MGYWGRLWHLQHAFAQLLPHVLHAFTFRFMKVAQGMYDRGMPRPMAAVTFAARSSFGL